MKNLLYLLLALLLPLLAAACSTKYSDAVPRTVVAAFYQDFTLQYSQTATLPQASQPELTVLVEELDYQICPKNARCSLPDLVSPTLAVTGVDGQTQLLKMPSAGQQQINSSLAADTVSIRANGRRYVVYYKNWGGDFDQDKPAREDFRLTFRVAKP
ncbi:hypothetical protein [Hymenobacter terrestris]|uniref:Lipoprotein n=1 Tax=Hymenobacter terrestris TaxID=2748310 RepID=A0ABX2Q314_9BACT|nr:hypothetical protein [Hymenobacter terrestris]NVO85228.1 hypothetical protein [Hymenobacter terrestris]